MPTLTIRAATLADAPFLTRGNAAMALETEYLVLDEKRLRAGVEALFADSARGLYYLAERDGRTLGQMMITYEWSDWRNGVFWWIQSVWVEPEARGQGVFKALYSHVERLARSTPGVCGLRLYVERDNMRAQTTYERCGMTRTAYQMFETDFVLGR
jgi:GNAT superfamily N-acetyltransferase